MVSEHLGCPIARLVVERACRLDCIAVDGTLVRARLFRGATLGYAPLFSLCGQLIIDVRQFKGVSLELLDVVEDVPDAVDGHLGQIVEPFINDLEYSLVLVGFADVLDDIFAVAAVDAEHLRCFTLILKLL